MILLQPKSRSIEELQAFHPKPAHGPYTMPRLSSSSVPSLSWLCLQRLSEFPDEVHNLPVRLQVQEHLAIEIAEAVQDPRAVDPRLWATLAQVYDNIPTVGSSFDIPLSDANIPQLQRIPATPRFSLMTVLDLPGCAQLTDDTVCELKQLHSLAAFDGSATSLSSYAVTALARIMHWTEDRCRRGPWGLRILRLRDCANVNNAVYPYLARFPLLSIIGTSRAMFYIPITNQTTYRP